MKSAIAIALLGQVSAAPAAGFNMLITKFEGMKTVAEGEKKTEVGELEDLNETCATNLQNHDDNIADQTEIINEQLKDKAANEEAKKGAEADKADADDKKSTAESMKSAQDAQYLTDKARREYDAQQMSNALGALGTAEASVSSNDKFTSATKTMLLNKLNALKQKINTDSQAAENVNKEAPGKHAAAMADFQAEITRLGALSVSLAGDITTLSGKIDANKLALAAARREKNDAMTARNNESKRCSMQRNTYEEGIEEKTARISALTSALQILGDGPAHADKAAEIVFMQKFAASFRPDATSFLQVPSSFANPKKPLLDLISKFGTNSRAGKYLSAIMTGSQNAKADAFAKIKSEITILYDTMVEQQKEDATSMTWCEDKEKELDLKKKDLETEVKNMNTAKDAAAAQATAHMTKATDARTLISTLQTDSEADVKRITKTQEENSTELVNLKNDMMLLEQAKRALKDAFTGRTEGSGEEILKIVEEVYGDYSKSLRVAEDTTRALEQELKETKRVFEQESKAAKKKEKSNLNRHNKFADDTTRLVDALRYKNAELDTCKKTIDTIFTKDDGKCHEYKSTYEQRMKDRKVEMENLQNAQKAMDEYMTSLGIKVSM